MTAMQCTTPAYTCCPHSPLLRFPPALPVPCRPGLLVCLLLLQPQNTKAYNQKEKPIIQQPFGILVHKKGATADGGEHIEPLTLLPSTKEKIQTWFNVQSMGGNPTFLTRSKGTWQVLKSYTSQGLKRGQ